MGTSDTRTTADTCPFPRGEGPFEMGHGGDCWQPCAYQALDAPVRITRIALVGRTGARYQGLCIELLQHKNWLIHSQRLAGLASTVPTIQSRSADGTYFNPNTRPT